MARLKATYLKAADKAEQCPSDGLPEVALAGRSNVGKSSFLNALCGGADLARVSKTPGRTRMLHFFDVAGGFRLVDLPGYGFARVAPALRAHWKDLVESYLTRNPAPALVLSLVDARRPATPEDLQLHAYLRQAGLNWEPVATKVDKLKQSERKQNLERLRVQLGLSIRPLAFSSVTGEGKEEAIGLIRDTVARVLAPPAP